MCSQLRTPSATKGDSPEKTFTLLHTSVARSKNLLSLPFPPQGGRESSHQSNARPPPFKVRGAVGLQSPDFPSHEERGGEADIARAASVPAWPSDLARKSSPFPSSSPPSCAEVWCVVHLCTSSETPLHLLTHKKSFRCYKRNSISPPPRSPHDRKSAAPA